MGALIDPSLLAGFATTTGGNSMYLPSGYTGVGGAAGGVPTTGADGSTQFPNYAKATKPDGMATSPSANPKPGDQYWDEATGTVKQYDGSSAAWTSAVGQTPASDPNFVATQVTLPGGQTTQLTGDEAAAQKALQNDVASGQTNLASATSAQDAITKQLQSGFAAQIAAMEAATKGLTGGISSGGTDLTGQIAAETQAFAKSQSDLVSQMENATASQSKAMSDLITQLNDTTNQNAQKAKAPNYARALAQNKALNSSGLSSTMLTGPGGVDPGTLSLGRTSLVGGS